MESERNLSLARRYVPVVSAVLCVLAVALIASTVHVEVTRTSSSGSNRRPVVQPSLPPPPPSADANTAPPSASTSGVPAWVGLLVRLLLVLAVLAILAAAVVIGRRIARNMRAGDRDEEFPDGAVLAVHDQSAHDRVAAALASGLDELADEGDPRGAVIAAWVRLETAAEDAGRTRRPGDTPTDLVTGLLADRQVPADVLSRFADLYLAARYSRRDVDPAMREVAVNALRSVEQSLRQAAGASASAAAASASDASDAGDASDASGPDPGPVDVR